jgi:3-phenylpropionate/cinnamic acid dioxygenase small subunit
MDGTRARRPVDAELYVAIQRFYADEAALLDAHSYAAWFEFLTTDVLYRITTSMLRDRERGPIEHAIVDEGWDTLKLRVDQLGTPKLTIAENPGSLHRRFVTNLRADHLEGTDRIVATVNLLVYRNRTTNAAVDLYAAERTDVLVDAEGGFLIASRHVRLDQSVLTGGTLNTLL